MTDATFYGLDATRDALVAAGWRIYQDSLKDRGCNWYACKPSEAGPDCLCNDKPPQYVAWPYRLDINGRSWESCEIERTGELAGGRWLSLKSYGAGSLDTLIADLPLICRRLDAAWTAAAEVR